jgi:anaerobic ribonucleoside-triphosphate reductase activating protein
MSVGEIITELKRNPLTDGLTLSGGEPFCQARDCSEIARAARDMGLNVWAYSGWTFEELLSGGDADKLRLLSLCGVLVDGRFVLAQKSLRLPWRGSENQRIIDVKRSLGEGRVIPVEGS